MPDSIVCTRALKGGSFSSEPGPTRLAAVLKLSNVKRVGVAPRAGRVGLPENAPAKAVGVDCGARFRQAHPVIAPITHGWRFDDSVLLMDLTLLSQATWIGNFNYGQIDWFSEYAIWLQAWTLLRIFPIDPATLTPTV